MQAKILLPVTERSRLRQKIEATARPDGGGTRPLIDNTITTKGTCSKPTYLTMP
jgi:hypothetical protein